MLERSQRSLGMEELRVLERYRQNDIGTTRFEAKYTFLAGTAGLVSLRAGRRRMEREAAAAAKWDPVIAVGVVEHLVAEASKAVRLDDNEANTAWFLLVKENQILCVWDWADDATERVEVDLIPGSPPTPLKISWAGRLGKIKALFQGSSQLLQEGRQARKAESSPWVRALACPSRAGESPPDVTHCGRTNMPLELDSWCRKFGPMVL